MLVTPDYTEAQDQVADGEYYVRISECEQKTSAKGSKYLNWTVETFNEEDPKNNGRKLWHITMLEGKGAGMLKQFVKTVTGEEMEGAFDTDQLIGREFMAVVVEDEQGRAKIKATKPIQ